MSGEGSQGDSRGRRMSAAPRSLLPSRAPSGAPISPRQGPAPRVLFIDDDAICRCHFQAMFGAHEVTVDVAASGDEAIGLARRHQYAVVISDLVMPRIDGLEVIDRIRKTQTNARYVVTTAQDPEQTEEYLSQKQLDGVLWKPWNVKQVLSVVERLLIEPTALTEPPAPLQLEGTILVVEDNPGDAELLEAHLKGALAPGATIAVEESLGDALHYLHQNPVPSVILLDLSLPDAKGIQAVVRLIELNVEAPIVVISGSSDESLAVQAVQAGAQDYLFKDQVDSRHLWRTIRHALDRKRSQLRLTRVALYDQLTGAANRALFEHRTEHAIATARAHNTRLALLFVDLDRFKQINDNFGHDVGDALLSAFAMRLSEVLGNDELLARLGGDEFAILVEKDGSAEQALSLSDTIQSALTLPFELTGQAHSLSASIGIAIFPDDGADEKQLLRHADVNMYRAKGKRRRQSESPPVAAVEVLRWEQIEDSLRPALERNEFLLHYQPIVDIHTRELIGIEAFLRWQRKDEGILQAAAFIPVLDQTGMIIPVGRWVLSQACADLLRFQALSSRRIWVSVNVTAVQIGDRNFGREVVETLALAGLAGHDLELEITEGVISAKSEAITEALRGLREQGVRLCMDDFGSGTSSLTQLSRSRIDAVKVDRSVTRELPLNDRSKATTSAIVALGHGLGLSVIAEGVETEGQHQVLKALGCESAQGNLYGLPMSTEALETWMTSRRDNKS